MLSPFQQQGSAVPEKLYVNTHFHQWMEKGIDQPDFPPYPHKLWAMVQPSLWLHVASSQETILIVMRAH